MTIRIRSKTDGFRRCGVAHSAKPTDWPDEQFSADELERLIKEPMLLVEVLPNDTANDDGKSADADDDSDGGAGSSTGDDSIASGETDADKPVNKKADK